MVGTKEPTGPTPGGVWAFLGCVYIQEEEVYPVTEFYPFFDGEFIPTKDGYLFLLIELYGFPRH